jgi:hypothetical protein
MTYFFHVFMFCLQRLITQRGIISVGQEYTGGIYPSAVLCVCVCVCVAGFVTLWD